MLNNPMLRIDAIIFIGIAFVFGILEGVYAHFHTFWPEGSPNCYAKRGQEITFKYFWGHPYEYIIFDSLKPNFYVVKPDGSKSEVKLKKIQMRDKETDKVRTAYEVKYKPTALGDFYLCLEAPPIFVEEEELFWRDYVKQPIHVMAEKGWDRPVGLPLEMVPLTRPYGIEEGFVFKGQALYKGKPLANAHVEIEKFNGFYVEGENLPVDQFGNEDVPMITR
ncbi:TPA: DUF4198 domain-containing protein, partial [Candidatus Poribacteria bacterium]|nr:DUF4198 domain-containing protein [Candidatus Poribacteria bacterium]